MKSIEQSLRPGVYWIRLAAGAIYVGSAQSGLHIADADVAAEVGIGAADPTHSISSTAMSVLTKLEELNFLCRPPVLRRIVTASHEDLLHRAGPELELMGLRSVVGGGDVEGLVRRSHFRIEIFGSNRLAYSLLALLQSVGFSHTELAARESSLRTSKSRHPSQSRIAPLLVTGLPIRRIDIGRLHKDVAQEIATQAALAAPARNKSDVSLIIATQNAPPELTQQWMSDGLSHLLISDLEGAALTIGPLVQPGVSPCSYCVDSQRALLNPYLPKVRMMQSVSEPAESPAGLVALVSGAVALGLLGFHETGESPWLGGTSEFNALDPCNPRHTTWQFYSSCGCLEVI